jgi:hypothetical protein
VGRTVPTYVQQISNLIAEWSKFRRVLRREDQVHFDRLINSVRHYSPSGTYQCSDNPVESVGLSMLLDLQKRVAALEERLKMPEQIVPVLQTGELFSEAIGEATKAT